MTETLFTYDFPESNSGQRPIRFPDLSPDERWLAYMVWSGEQRFRGSEHQDVEIVSLDRAAGPFAISERGGVWWSGGAWSPDGTRYAYADYDGKGQSQLFHAAPDSSDRVQVTAFSQFDEIIGPVKWSADGDRLVFTSWAEDTPNGSLWTARADGTEVVRMGPEEMPRVAAEAFWWSQDGESIVAQTVPAIGEAQSGGLYWIDLDGTVQHTLNHEVVPGELIALAFPTTDSRMMRFVGGNGLFYVYDAAEGNITSWPAHEHLPYGEERPVIDAILSPPDGMLDLAYCSRLQ